MLYFVGWHQANSGASGTRNFERCLISINRLLDRVADFVVNDWILDSGAFTRVTRQHRSKGHLSTRKYAALARRWQRCGRLVAVVSQDYMCEPIALAATGLDVATHQRVTLLRYDNLCKLLDGSGLYVMPILQGYEPQEYVDHLRLYGDRLVPGAWVGVGSVCKRNGSPASLLTVLTAIKLERPDLRLHGFGLKLTALGCSGVSALLHSSDSQAHSFACRQNKYSRSNNDPLGALAYVERVNAVVRFPHSGKGWGWGGERLHH